MGATLTSAPLLLAAALAFVGGLLSFLSPCVFPLVPAYLGHLAGTSLQADKPPARATLLAHALAFVLGFACIFTVAGIAIGLFIQSLQVGLDALRIVGGVAVIVMGLHTAGVITIPLLYRQAKLDDGRIASGSVVSSFLIGVFFAAGWSPCVGTILTGIFALSTTQTAQAGLLFFIFAGPRRPVHPGGAAARPLQWLDAAHQPASPRHLVGKRRLPGAGRRAADHQLVRLAGGAAAADGAFR